MSKLLSYFFSSDKESHVFSCKSLQAKQQLPPKPKRKRGIDSKQLKLTQLSFGKSFLSKSSSTDSKQLLPEKTQPNNKNRSQQTSILFPQTDNINLFGSLELDSDYFRKDTPLQKQFILANPLVKIPSETHVSSSLINSNDSCDSADSPLLATQTSEDETQATEGSFNSLSLSQIFSISSSVSKSNTELINSKRSRVPYPAISSEENDTENDDDEEEEEQLKKKNKRNIDSQESSSDCSTGIDAMTCAETMSPLSSEDNHNDDLQSFQDSQSLSQQCCDETGNCQNIDYLRILFEREHSQRNQSLQLANGLENIDQTIRSIVVNWVIELCSDYKLGRHTCHLSIDLFDRYVHLKPAAASKSNIQLIAATCVFITSKKEQQTCPDISEFVKSSNGTYTQQQFCKQEIDILTAVGFRIEGSTHEEWLRNMLNSWMCFLKVQETSSQHELFEIQLLEEMQGIIELIYIDSRAQQFDKCILAFALVYIFHGLSTNEFLLEDLTTHFTNLTNLFNQDFFASYNTVMLRFFGHVYAQIQSNDSKAEHQIIETLPVKQIIKAIEYAAQLFGYFNQQHYRQSLSLAQAQLPWVMSMPTGAYDFISSLQ